MKTAKELFREYFCKNKEVYLSYKTGEQRDGARDVMAYYQTKEAVYDTFVICGFYREANSLAISEFGEDVELIEV